MDTPMAQNWIGRKYARLTILTNPVKGNKPRFVDALCDCGVVKSVRLPNVIKGCTRSCGCFRAENPPRLGHGLSKLPEYDVWAAMKKRCNNPSHEHYHSYGGRGIGYSERWETFEPFFEDMGPRPGKGYSLDRINNDLGYSKENCRWATNVEQGANRRNVRKIDGEAAYKLAEDRGVSRAAFHKRLKYGWSVERAINTPVNSHLKRNR